MRTGRTSSLVTLKGLSILQPGAPFFSDSRESRLLVSSEYDPWSILEMTYAYLSGSAPIVFHCPHLQVWPHMRGLFIWVRSPGSQILVDLQAKMKSAGGYLGANITEAWKRKYQVKCHSSTLFSSNSPEGLAGASWKDAPNDEYVRHRRIHIARIQDVYISSAPANSHLRPDVSPFVDSTIPTHKRYLCTVKRSVRSRNLLKPKGLQNHQERM